MKKMRLIASLWLIFTISGLYAQEKSVLHFHELQEPEQFGGLVSSTMLRVDNMSQFKGLPSDTLEAAVYVMNLQRSQSGYTSMLKGYYSKEFYNELVAHYETDTTDIYRKADIINAIPVFSAMLPNNRKIIIPDLNSNGDFSDDEAFEYTITNFDQKFPLDSAKMLEVDYDFYYEGQLHKRHLKFKLQPTDKSRSFKDPQDKRLMVYFVMGDRRQSGNVSSCRTPTMGGPDGQIVSRAESPNKDN